MTMKVAEMIKRALEQQGLKTLKKAAAAAGISTELLRLTINDGHIPKDAVLGRIANRLGLDKRALILAAHQERAPRELRGYFLAPVKEQTWTKKRVWPLSGEQCEYLGKVLHEREIQLIRKFRQVPDEPQVQIEGFVDYLWQSKRQTSTGEPVVEARDELSLAGSSETDREIK
jgi:transcriptional regulator with XRE-family HTH domain